MYSPYCSGKTKLFVLMKVPVSPFHFPSYSISNSSDADSSEQ